MVVVDRPPANAFVAYARRVYNPLGFAKGYNFILWFVFGGALMGFTLARFMYLNVDGVFCGNGPSGAVPGECYYYRRGLERAGLILHLAGILPAGFLAVFQFVPVIRHKILIIHRISGYVILLLSVVGIVGVFMIARHGLGGGLDIQSAAGLASIIFVTCKAIAFYNIKVLQIEQHRAWMLRAWVIASFIITLRLIGAIMAYIIGRPGSEYYVVQPCYVVDNMFKGSQAAVEALYPDCRAYYSGANPNVHVPVRADTTSGRPDEAASAFNATFGPSAFLALFLHTLGAELYLRLTPAEADRLRRVSYQRQLEAGMKNPGNGGLTVQRFGDAEPWFPKQQEARVVDESESAANDATASELTQTKTPAQ
ncbi:hypothetical protein OCS_05312 [Ophiocordyceps sinensis CO18]|uniref:Microtubule associated protein n=1 Tax=Ophiocordyceps sinensis (strain Co18 / CGMCC 3.14243) TaxID=911162 RepID=T5A982_OPHSC|nr:hypothetical protein OCS_05312 [Ophiocordyceps sinensis CO18]